MAKALVILTTYSVPWKIWRRDLTTAPAIDFSSGVANPAGGGGWIRRTSLVARDVCAFFGYQVRNLMIAPFAESCAPNGNVRFRVDTYRGRNNDMERVLLASTVFGQYKFSAISGIAAHNSGRYAEIISCISSFGNTITVKDVGATNGKGYLSFPLNGAGYVAINLASTVPSGRFGFLVAGY